MMRNLSKKIFVFALSGIVLLQPISRDIPNNFTTVVEAHSGKTDGSGGHHDNKNKSGLGSYHYHCGGYPAHLHDGGVCPYSSTSSSSTSTATSVSSSSSSSTSTTISTSGKSVKLSSGSSASLSNDLIKIIQDVLNQKGYDCGTADGVIGSKTKTALEDFLKDNENSSDTDSLIISMVAESLGID